MDARDKRGHDDREFGVLNAGALHVRGIQEICTAGKRGRSRHRRRHRRRFRLDRQLAGRRYLVAHHRRAHGGFDFSNYFLPLSSKVTADSLVEAKKQGAVLAWGNFVTIVINFIIIAWILFLVVKLMNRMLQSEPANAPALTKQEMLLTEIRDLLKREQE